MSILVIFLVIIAVGVLLWVVNNYVTMDPKIKQILNVVVVLALVVWLLKVFGVWAYLSKATV